MGLGRKIPRSFSMKTWISSTAKLTLQVLGTDLNGGCMNPAVVMRWAYAAVNIQQHSIYLCHCLDL
ncbi:unnamed protein product [Eruca vesicaria subsp. sativa]|uniref:Uncharacterized protein n=1 Tax=Eruca vesicaria subsp. sativa TaxID=29727 RepID=A0ABC8J865_ERUVS|nr:unnamed protein product [Eruca vesicaria subsp. sativa]